MYCKHLFAAIGSAVLYLGSAEAAENCTLKPLASIPIDIAADGRILVNVEINGMPVKLRLELARIIGYLSADLAKKLDLTMWGGKGTSSDYREDDGGAVRFRVTTRQVKLGQLIRNEVVANVVEHLDGVDGTIGRDWFEGYDIEINPIGHRINMFSQDHCPGKVVYWADSFFVIDGPNTPQREVLWTTVLLDGKELTGYFDTGRSETTMSAATAKIMFDVTANAEGTPMKAGVGITGQPQMSFDHIFAALDFGPLKFPSKKVVITDFNYDGEVSSRRHLLLGMDVIGRLRSFIAYREQKVYFTLATEGRATATSDQSSSATPGH